METLDGSDLIFREDPRERIRKTKITRTRQIAGIAICFLLTLRRILSFFRIIVSRPREIPVTLLVSLSFSHSLTNSPGVWYLFSGFFSRHFETTASIPGGIFSFHFRSGGSGSLTCRRATSTGLSESKGTFPVSIS